MTEEWFDTLKAKTKRQRALSEWTREDWQYISGDKREMKKPRSKRGRYAPKSVAESLTAKERAYENRKKREGSKKGKQFVPRGKSAKKKYKRVEGL